MLKIMRRCIAVVLCTNFFVVHFCASSQSESYEEYYLHSAEQLRHNARNPFARQRYNEELCPVLERLAQNQIDHVVENLIAQGVGAQEITDLFLLCGVDAPLFALERNRENLIRSLEGILASRNAVFSVTRTRNGLMLQLSFSLETAIGGALATRICGDARAHMGINSIKVDFIESNRVKRTCQTGMQTR